MKCGFEQRPIVPQPHTCGTLICNKIEQKMQIAWRRMVLCCSVVLCGLFGRSALGAGFESRLQSLSDAIDVYVASSKGPAAPPEWRKILWFHLAGDRQPDALVVLRTRRDECAAAARGPTPCRALVLTAQSDGTFRMVSEFTLREHPVALAYNAQGVRDLYYTRDDGANPRYAQYRYTGDVFSRAEGELTAEQLQQTSVLLADDRNMPLLSDQLYAARQFPNDEARLAPFRVHYDAVAFSAQRRRKLIHDAQYNVRAKLLVDAVEMDARSWVKAIAWPQTLELRLWACVDWMIERRFWAVENARLGRLGACVEPAIFAVNQSLVRSDEAFIDLVRVSMLQQLGAAWLLRVAPLTPQQRIGLSHGDPEEMQFSAGVVAAVLAHRMRQPGLDRAAEALNAYTKVSDEWFALHEQVQFRFISRSPELRSFDSALRQSMRAHQCVRRVLGIAPAPAFAKLSCEPRALDQARVIATQLQEDIKQ